jgi:hypothetical protein
MKMRSHVPGKCTFLVNGYIYQTPVWESLFVFAAFKVVPFVIGCVLVPGCDFLLQIEGKM